MIFFVFSEGCGGGALANYLVIHQSVVKQSINVTYTQHTTHSSQSYQQPYRPLNRLATLLFLYSCSTTIYHHLVFHSLSSLDISIVICVVAVPGRRNNLSCKISEWQPIIERDWYHMSYQLNVYISTNNKTFFFSSLSDNSTCVVSWSGGKMMIIWKLGWQYLRYLIFGQEMQDC